MNKYTPGPWSVESGPHKTVTGEPADWSITCPKGTVAMLHDADTVGPRYERDANARLIAAAPQMLEALRGVLAALTQHATFPADIEAARIWSRAAIEKAEGKS